MNDGFITDITRIKEESDIFAKAKLIDTLIHGKDIRIIDLAKSLEKTPSYICHLLRLTHLPEIIVDGYYSKLVSISHLFVLSRIKDEKKLLELYEQLLKNNYSVQQTEDIVREFLYAVKNGGDRLNKVEIEGFIEKVKGNLKDVEVKVVQTRIKGKLVVEIKGNLEDTSQSLKNILQRLT